MFKFLKKVRSDWKEVYTANFKQNDLMGYNTEEDENEIKYIYIYFKNGITLKMSFNMKLPEDIEKYIAAIESLKEIKLGG